MPGRSCAPDAGRDRRFDIARRNSEASLLAYLEQLLAPTRSVGDVVVIAHRFLHAEVEVRLRVNTGASSIAASSEWRIFVRGKRFSTRSARSVAMGEPSATLCAFTRRNGSPAHYRETSTP